MRNRILLPALPLLVAAVPTPAPAPGVKADVAVELRRIADAMERGERRDPLGEPCAAGRDARGSDLCAQWKAADAAASAARSAERSYRLDVAEVLAGFATLAAAVAAAYYARLAARENKRSADAAVEALNHQRELSAAQVRPFLHFDKFEVEVSGEPGSRGVSLRAPFRNSGPTAAYAVSTSAVAITLAHPFRRATVDRLAPVRPLPRGVVAPAKSGSRIVNLSARSIALIEGGHHALIFKVRIDYRLASDERAPIDHEEVIAILDKRGLERGRSRLLSGKDFQPSASVANAP